MKTSKPLPIKILSLGALTLFLFIVGYFLVIPAFFDGENGGSARYLNMRPAPWALSKEETEKFKFSENEQKGRYHFLQYCAPCHGPDGKGNGPQSMVLNKRPRSFLDKSTAFKNGLTKDGVLKTLNEGVLESQMPNFHKLPDEVKFNIADFILYLNKNPALF